MRSRASAVLAAPPIRRALEPEELAPQPEPEPVKAPSLVGSMAKILVGNVGMMGLGVVTGVITARVLLAAGRGEVSAILSAVLFLSLAGSLGNWTGLARVEATQPHKSNEAVGAALLIVALLGSVTIAFAQLILKFLFWEQSAELLATGRWLIFMIYPVMLFQASNELMVGRQRFGRVSFDRFIRPFYHAVGVVALWATGNISVTNVLLVIGASYALVGTISFGSLIVESGVARPSMQVLTDSYRFGFRIFGGVLSQKSNHELDLMLMPALVAPQVIGIYVVAVSAAAIVAGGFSHLRSLVFGLVSRGESGDNIKLIEFTARLTLLGASLAALTLFIGAPYLVDLVYGVEFVESVPLLRWLLPGVVALVFAEVLFGALASLDKPLWATSASLFGLVVTVVGIALTVKPFGATGAAITTTVAYSVMMLASVRFASRLGISPRRLLSLRLLREDLGTLSSSAMAALGRSPSTTAASAVDIDNSGNPK